MTIGDQPVRAVKIGHHLFHQLGTLDQPFLDRRPFRVRQYHRNRAEWPIAGRSGLVAVFAKENSTIRKVPLTPGERRGNLGRCQGRHMLDQPVPCRTHCAMGIDQFIGHTRQRAILGEKLGIDRFRFGP